MGSQVTETDPTFDEMSTIEGSEETQKFEPAPHHRRLRLRVRQGARLPKADPRPTPVGHQHLEREFTQMLLDQGRICPSNSPVGAPMLFVPKPKKTPDEPTRWRRIGD